MIPADATGIAGSQEQQDLEMVGEPSVKEISTMLDNIAFFGGNDSNMVHSPLINNEITQFTDQA